jgi:ADP-heptose:LPS heptosyltransferase
LERWWALRRALEELRPARPVVVVGGPLEAWATEKPDLEGLIGLAASASAWIGPDSGPTHLAARLGAPTFAVFGPSDAGTWAPPGAEVVAFEAEISEVVARVGRRLEASPPAISPAADTLRKQFG